MIACTQSNLPLAAVVSSSLSAQFAKWVVRNDGPALWQVLTPKDCTHGQKSAQYIVCLIVFDFSPTNTFHTAPINIFDSKFIIQTFVPFVKGCKGSCKDYGYLLGALALLATGVSRILIN
jgi:hypothetical protein